MTVYAGMKIDVYIIVVVIGGSLQARSLASSPRSTNPRERFAVPWQIECLPIHIFHRYGRRILSLSKLQWTDHEIGLEWFKMCFEPDGYRLFILDGHGSRITQSSPRHRHYYTGHSILCATVCDLENNSVVSSSAYQPLNVGSRGTKLILTPSPGSPTILSKHNCQMILLQMESPYRDN
jgi:hypothetical protein